MTLSLNVGIVFPGVSCWPPATVVNVVEHYAGPNLVRKWVFFGRTNLLAPPLGDRMGGTYKQAPERHQISLGASSVSLGLSGGEAFREMLAFGAHFPA